MEKDRTPKCPFCGRNTAYGKTRDSFSISFGEAPIYCSTHGEVGYRDLDYGEFVLYKKHNPGILEYWGA